MNPPLNVAMVGVGGYGRYRRERMRETGLFKLLAAYDLSPEALASAQAQDGAAPVDSYEALLDTPGIEAVIISTGATYHAQQAIAAMDRGLHVFVEKPLCSTPEEVRALLAKQAETGVVVCVGHHDHSHEARALHIKRMIDDGVFGTIAAIEKTTAHGGGLVIKKGEWRADPSKNPGGMLFQCGVHALHELMFYFGPVKSVYCTMRYDVHETLTADAACCVLIFESGLIGTLNAYHVTPYSHTLEILGTDCRLRHESRYYGEADWTAIQKRRDTQCEPYEPVTISGETDLCGSLRSFCRAIREGGTPYPSLRDGAMAVQVVFAAEESSRTGRNVEIPSL